MSRATELRIEWWRYLLPKIGRCRSALFGIQCAEHRWHVGWHQDGDLGWERHRERA